MLLLTEFSINDKFSPSATPALAQLLVPEVYADLKTTKTPSSNYRFA